MARIWTAGGEMSVATHEFTTVTGNFFADTGHIRTGSYAFNSNNSGSGRITLFNTAQSIVGYFRTYFYIATLPSAESGMMRVNDAASGVCCDVTVTTSGQLKLYRGASASLIGTTSALNTAQWYRVELKLDCTGLNMALDLRLDGSSVASTADAGNQSIESWGRLIIGNVTAVTTHDFWYDDLAVNDASGSNQNSWPGAGKVITLKPNGDGDAHQWNNTANAAGSSSNYTLVNEATPDDATTMVQSPALPNQVDLYTMADSGIAASDTVNVVHIVPRFRNNTADATATFVVKAEKTSGGTKTTSASILPNSTTWKSGDRLQSTNAGPPPLTMHLDPDGAAWTQATLDTMQAGIENTVVGVNRIQVSTLWATVDYTPFTATSNPPPINVVNTAALQASLR